MFEKGANLGFVRGADLSNVQKRLLAQDLYWRFLLTCPDPGLLDLLLYRTARAHRTPRVQ